MQTSIEKALRDTPAGREAERIVRACVHCGFCTATCPTYQLMGDELDGPRGRIYLIKSMLEANTASHKTMRHLDRCLTCRACETTCPSGVEYGKLVDIGRQVIEDKVRRRWHERGFRWLILRVMPYRGRFTPLLRLGQCFRWLLPPALRGMIPPRPRSLPAAAPRPKGGRRVLLFKGCVQPALAPEINQATVRVLHRLNIAVDEIAEQGCCGALPQHLSAAGQAAALMRRNIDAFWPHVSQGAEAIISTASGCGVQLKEYGYLLREDPEYADKAARIAALSKDIAEYLAGLELDGLPRPLARRLVFQSPCTLQHGQKLNGVTEALLERLGFELAPVKDAHLCCGSAGVYSLLQGQISRRLRAGKIKNLLAGRPEAILTANIGCAKHLQQASPVPVKHWIEEVAGLLPQP